MNTVVLQERKPRYAIGIDLGTSHCALAYKSLKEVEGQVSRLPNVLEIQQWASETTLVKSPLLPSWYYVPPKSELKRGFFQSPVVTGGNEESPGDPTIDRPSYVVGRVARNKASQTPGRVIHSAKSWFCANQVDRKGKILPWASSEVIGQDRKSPVDVAAAYLSYLKDQWNENFPRDEDRFENQEITITVPASFDEVAQRLTLDAAATLGVVPLATPLPSLRLLEEPQAAFYSWLAVHDSLEQQKQDLGMQSTEEKIILVCDIGGGTSDFSLFKAKSEGTALHFERIGVSEHILLGGDNIDLAIAHDLEVQIGSAGALPHKSFASLTHSVRALKEDILENQGDFGQVHTLGVVVGESLFGSSRSVSITKQKMFDLILEGFFPKVPLNHKVYRAKGGLKQIGLPYAQDSAMTGHLAEFLNTQQARVDAVLMVGGTLTPMLLQARILDQIEDWQGYRPRHLAAPSMDLAIAQGAALYGYARFLDQKPRGFGDVSLIESGYPRSVYLEVQREQESVLVCLIPKGFKGSSGGTTLPQRERDTLTAWTNRPVRFQLWTARTRSTDRPGDLIDPKTAQEDSGWTMLPALMTTLKEDRGRSKGKSPYLPQERQIPVSLALNLAETGILSVHCVPSEPTEEMPRKGWPLDFNLRFESQGEEAPPKSLGDTKLVTAKQDRVAVPEELIQAVNLVYGKKIQVDPPSPKSLIKDCERILGLTRDQWSLELLRAIWSSLGLHGTRRGRSEVHEATWLSLAGYCLRPGFGFPGDEAQVLSLWRQTEEGLVFPKDRTVVDQFWIMQRRICGGLGATEQTKILTKLIPMIRKGEVPSAEVFKLVGALERADQSEKLKIGMVLAQQIEGNRPKFMDDKIWALARIASRVMLYAEPEHILQPSFVETWCQQLAKISVKEKAYPRLNLFWAFAARRVLEREFSLSEKATALALSKLQEAKAPSELRAVVEKHVPVDYKLKVQLFGESLPLGLTLQGAEIKL